jgi:cytochrome c oxidase subunit II
VRSNRRMKWLAIPVAASVALVLAGCTPEQQRGFLPGEDGVTNHTDGITGLWVSSWIVLLGVGIITWGLILWATIAYRRRKGQTGMPVQLRYNMPIETFFTIVPVILVLGFFGFTAVEEEKIIARPAPEVVIDVYGKRWAWDFNYINSANEQESVYFQGVQVEQDPNAEVQGSIKPSTLPVLYLPVGKQVELRLMARDVIHSFWVVEFLNKMDMIPGKEGANANFMSFIPQKEGTYMGKCAELCGEYHSAMLFEVRVVSEAEYNAYLGQLRSEGNVGLIGNEYDANNNLPTNKPAIEESAEG